MAEAATPSGSLLTTKWFHLPVWLWAIIGLGVAWGIAKWRASKATAATSSADPGTATVGANSSESQDTAPEFIIENNMPATVGTPSAPVTTPTAPAAPVVTPPTTKPTPPVVAKPTPAPVTTKPKPPIKYVVKSGDNLTTIAKKYGTTAAALFTYNTTPGVRPAATIATLKKRGPSLLYSGETILIPQK